MRSGRVTPALFTALACSYDQHPVADRESRSWSAGGPSFDAGRQSAGLGASAGIGTLELLPENIEHRVRREVRRRRPLRSDPIRAIRAAADPRRCSRCGTPGVGGLVVDSV
jgi:hypothetical protein